MNLSALQQSPCETTGSFLSRQESCGLLQVMEECIWWCGALGQSRASVEQYCQHKWTDRQNGPWMKGGLDPKSQISFVIVSETIFAHADISQHHKMLRVWFRPTTLKKNSAGWKVLGEKMTLFFLHYQPYVAWKGGRDFLRCCPFTQINSCFGLIIVDGF